MAKGKKRNNDSKFKRDNEVHSNDNSRGTNEREANRERNGNRSRKGTMDSKSTSGNHISWYISSPQQLLDVASIPFANSLSGRTSFGDGHMFVPGVVRLGITPTIGSQASSPSGNWKALKCDPSDAINVSARAIYSFVRHANSGHSNYEAADLMMYIMAMDSVYSMVNWCKQIYGTAMLYNYKNKYAPTALLRAMGVGDVDAFINNLAQFRTTLNNNILKVQQLAVPKVLPIFDRHQYLFSKIYMDRLGPKAQFYVFSPDCHYEYNDEDVSEFGVRLRKVKHTRSGVNGIYFGSDPVQDLDNLFRSMLDKLITSEDMNIMSGDILKAYGSNIWTMDLVDELYTTEMVYDLAILEQINNASILDELGVSDIGQPIGTNLIGQAVQAKWSSQAEGAKLQNVKILNTWDVNGSPESVIYATRLTALPNLPYYEDEYESNGKPNLIHGSEVVTSMDVFQDAFDASHDKRFNVDFDMNWLTSNDDPTDANEMLELIVSLCSFERHPQIILKNGERYSIVDDLSNYTQLNAETLRKIHQATISTGFGLPYALRGNN